MKKRFLRKMARNLLCGLAVSVVVATGGMEVSAYTTDDHPLSQTSMDGEVFTIAEELPYYEDYHGSDKTDYSFWYSKESGSASTGISYNLPVVGVGQHLYGYDRYGMVPVAEWKVHWEHARCIHSGITNEDGYHNLSEGPAICMGAYWSGWFPYCADCGERIRDYYHYLSRETAENLQYYNVDKGYFYRCPLNGRLEQAREKDKHECKAVSYNMYIVRYYKNGPAAGEMGDSTHMYNNATEYNGTPIEPDTHLYLNEFRYPGYTFDSWNTKRDGSGQRFEDGQEIFNLTDENYNENAGTGMVGL